MTGGILRDVYTRKLIFFVYASWKLVSRAVLSLEDYHLGFGPDFPRRPRETQCRGHRGQHQCEVL